MDNLKCENCGEEITSNNTTYFAKLNVSDKTDSYKICGKCYSTILDRMELAAQKYLLESFHLGVLGGSAPKVLGD